MELVNMVTLRANMGGFQDVVTLSVNTEMFIKPKFRVQVKQ